MQRVMPTNASIHIGISSILLFLSVMMVQATFTHSYLVPYVAAASYGGFAPTKRSKRWNQDQIPMLDTMRTKAIDNVHVVRRSRSSGWSLSATTPSRSSSTTDNKLDVKTNRRSSADRKQRQKTQLRWVLQSIENYGTDPLEKGKSASPELLTIIQQLNDAKTQRDITEVGRQLEELNIVETESYPIQERLVKATALCGLVNSSASLLGKLLQSLLARHEEDRQTNIKNNSNSTATVQEETSKDDSKNDRSGFEYDYVPSHMAYTALCNSLRRVGRRQQLEEVLHQLSAVVRKVNSRKRNQQSNTTKITKVHSIAFNTFLASLCDTIERNNPMDANLEVAWKWLQPGIPQGVFCVEPDIASYNTIIHAAAKAGNQTIVREIWDTIQQQQQKQLQNQQIKSHEPNDADSDDTKDYTSSDPNLEPDIFTFNALLEATSDVEEKLDLLKQIMDHHAVVPNRFTIDLVIYPLIRAGRVGDLEDLLDNFVQSHSEQIVSDAFAAFFISLSSKGELASARALFDTYILPWYDAALSASSSSSTTANIYRRKRQTIVRPNARHFNILIEGYRQLAQSTSQRKMRNVREQSKKVATNQRADERDASESFDDHNRDDDDKDGRTDANDESMREEARCLYNLMLKMDVEPDQYTFTSMMGTCTTSVELSNFIKQYHEQRLKKAGNDLSRWNIWTPAVLRAAVTAYGCLGDPSSACVIFDSYGGSTSTNARVWNALFGALADGAKLGNTVIDGSSCSATELAVKVGQEKPEDVRKIIHLVNGLTCIEAVKKIMGIIGDPRNNLPPPNSQTFCIAASAFQYGETRAGQAIELFNDAAKRGIPADGRFINAVVRCFGDDIDAALAAWKDEIRTACVSHENRTRMAPPSVHRTHAKNLIAAYNGLLYVCGRAGRPDVAVRIAYAMNREGIEPNEVSLNSYQGGKRIRKIMEKQNKTTESSEQTEEKRFLGARFAREAIPKLLPKLGLIDMYEDLLYVECTKYDKNDKRRSGDKRVRIIV